MTETCCEIQHMTSGDGISYRLHEDDCPALDARLAMIENSAEIAESEAK